MNIVKPAPYPNTDTAEITAISVLTSLFDLNLIKCDFKGRDKVPNFDGTIELVKQNQIPLGKFDVQVKKIRKNQKKYNCPSELVGYSKVTTLPLLLICVDTSQKKAYWRQITPMMAEFKINQKTFTIKFNDTSDLINKENLNYYNKWIQIAYDFQERVSSFWRFATKQSNILLKDIPLELTQRIHEFIVCINNFLDNDFIVVKEYFFPDILKLGVGFLGMDSEKIALQLYKIWNEEDAPLIQKISSGSLFSKNPNEKAVCEYRLKISNLDDPTSIAKNYVVNKFIDLVKKKVLPIKGCLVSSEVLFSFIDKYYVCLGLKPNLENYSIDEINFGFNKYLYSICRTVIKEINEKSNLINVDLDWLNSFVRDKGITIDKQYNDQIPFIIESKNISIKSVIEALDFLLSINTSSINRKIPKRIQEDSYYGDWSFHIFSKKEEIEYVSKTLNNSLTEYEDFLNGNQIHLESSNYLDSKTLIIFEYFPISIVNQVKNTYIHGRPMIRIYFAEKSRSRLHKIKTIIKNESDSSEELEKWPSFEKIIDGYKIKIKEILEDDACFLLSDSPSLGMIYKMLEKDLNIQKNSL